MRERPSLVLVCLLGLAVAFNVDTKNAVVHQRGGYFGYSIDFFKESQGLTTLVVGAPESENGNPNLRGIQRPGALFSCSTNQKQCRQVYLDEKQGNRQVLNGSVLRSIEDKAFQFLGATVRTSKNHEKLIVCAPQYKYFFAKLEVIEPVGSCFYTDDGYKTITEYASCRQEPARHGRHRFGYGQCGFSAALPDKDKRAFIGAPGVWYWQGAVFSQSTRNETERPNTDYSPAKYDHEMLGFATAVGDFDGDRVDDIVAGVPRGNELVGKLVLYTAKLRHLQNLTDAVSPQRGQHCGSAIAVTDLNRDGLDDIIMGCPFFTDYVTVVDAKTQERKPQYDVGKVIVFIQTASGVFGKSEVIVGQDQWGRFGFSIAAAGDLNQDGYNDFIVGAPYAGHNKQGSVYVFHGSKDGVRTKYTQKIEAKQLGRSDLSTFGFSVAGGVDVDGNGYPDIGVGAWKTGAAAVLLSKPVVTVTGSTDSEGLAINIEDKNCEVDAKIGQQACRVINVCLKYEGKGETPNQLDFKLKFNLDDTSPEPRAYFLRKDITADRTIQISPDSKTKDHPNVIERVVQLEKGKQRCYKQRFFASSTMKDKLSPIHWSVNYTYEESPSGKLAGGHLEPAIDNTVPLTFENKLNIANNCGKDDVCIPDLIVTAVSDKSKFLLGTKDQTMKVNVTVRNKGEDAYETKLFFDVPPGFEYSGVESVDDKSPPSCSPTSETVGDDEAYTFACELGNPLQTGKEVQLAFRLTANEKKPPLKPIAISAKVNSTNAEGEGSYGDNVVSFEVPVDLKNQLSLAGRSDPEQVDFSMKNRTTEDLFYDSEIGPLISHRYQVQNRGPSEIDSVTVDIFWPSFSTEGGHLLYLITDPVVDKPEKGRCRVKQQQNINPLNLKLTGEHLPTEAPKKPPPREPSEEADEEEEGDEQDEGEEEEGEEKTPSKVGGDDDDSGEFAFIPHTTGKPQFGWKETELSNQKGDYASEENEESEYGDEDEGERGRDSKRRRTKRQEPPKRRKQKKPKGTRAPLPEGAGDSSKARFSDLRDAVVKSKEAGGTVDYQGIVSRASVECSNLRCTHIECDFFSLGEGEYVLVDVFARLFTNTLVDERNPGGEISSLGVARVASTRINWPHKPTLVAAVTTDANAVDDDASQQGVPWWLYLLAILIGLVILALLILLLWRCGFFKRNRPQTERADLVAGSAATAHYADTKERYRGDYNSDEHGPML